jgi:uncharacterized protein (TIGR02453 family)
MAGPYFTRDGIDFLKQLKKHNEKAWFEKNKHRYEAGVRDPATKLLGDLAPVLRKISKRFVVDLRPNGGSLSRIYRDTRFSKDKSPYKTALFVHFRHEDGDEEAAPAFYMHLGPGESGIGGGVWHPAAPKLAAIRDAIVKDEKGWAKAKAKTGLGKTCMLSADSLKKVPKGYDLEHVHADDLRRRDFGVSVPVPDASLTSRKLVSDVDGGFRRAAPVLEFLCGAVGLSF